MSESGPFVLVPTSQYRQRTLEVLLPHLERAMEAPFEDDDVQIELANFHNRIRSTLQTVPVLQEMGLREPL